jgi:class 3 adenylate cyclase
MRALLLLPRMLLLLLLLLAPCAARAVDSVASTWATPVGVLDLRQQEDLLFEEAIPIQGHWEVVEGCPTRPEGVRIPQDWRYEERSTDDRNCRGGRHRLRVLVPPGQWDMALRFAPFSDSIVVTITDSSGLVTRRAWDDPDLLRPDIVGFSVVGECTIEVASGALTPPFGGVQRPWMLGWEPMVRLHSERLMLLELVVVAACGASGLFFFFWLIDRRWMTIGFIVLSLTMGVRALATGQLAHLLGRTEPMHEILLRLDFLTPGLGFAAFSTWLVGLYRKELAGGILDRYRWVQLGCALIPLIVSPRVAPFAMLVIVQLMIVGTAILSMSALVGLIRARKPQALLILFGYTISLSGAILEIMGQHDLIAMQVQGTTTFSIFVATTMVAHLRQMTEGWNRHRDLSQRLAETTGSTRRFVPEGFLAMLGVDNLRELAEVPALRRRMNVLFIRVAWSDPRRMMETSAMMIAEMNDLFRRLFPIVARHGGMVDKTMEFSILCLFPGRPDHALAAAMAISEMFEDVSDWQVHMGLHRGELMLGTVGSEERLESTVIGDVVNTAHRLQEAAGRRGVQLICSDVVRTELNDAFAGKFVTLGELQLRGKEKPLLLWTAERSDEPPPATVSIPLEE